MALVRIDHVAIEVADFDDRLAFLTSQLGLELRRRGHLAADPSRRIAMLADRHGVKIELVEGAAADDRLLHLAFDVGPHDRVDTQFAALIDADCEPITTPRRLEVAGSRTATARRAGGVFQLVAYDADSPDRAESAGVR